MSTQKFSNPLITETDRVTELKLQQKQQQRQHQEQEHHQVADDQISSINGSVLSESPVSHITGFSPGIDPDIARMETLMEQWLGDLKRNVLVSLQFKISIQEVTFRFLNDRKGRLYFQKRLSFHMVRRVCLRGEKGLPRRGTDGVCFQGVGGCLPNTPPDTDI